MTTQVMIVRTDMNAADYIERKVNTALASIPDKKVIDIKLATASAGEPNDLGVLTTVMIVYEE